jgi:ribosomal protein L11 methyltransferase
MKRGKTKKPLSQVTVLTMPEAEEAVAQALERLFETVPSIYTNRETGVSTVTAFVEAPVKELENRTADLANALQAIRRCRLDLGLGTITIEKVKREDWAESWKKYFKTIEVGSKLLIKPSWSKRKARAGQAVVTLDPGLSFGTGQHPTTAYCLRKLTNAYRPGASLLDIGCGSGILAIAAAKLGYAPVEAFDFDPVAVTIAKGNTRRNRVEKKVACARKDLTKIAASSRTKFDVICANLMADLLIAEHKRILARLKPGGSLILAGILASEFEKVQHVFEARGLKMRDTKVEREWQSGLFRA